MAIRTDARGITDVYMVTRGHIIFPVTPVTCNRDASARNKAHDSTIHAAYLDNRGALVHEPWLMHHAIIGLTRVYDM